MKVIILQSCLVAGEHKEAGEVHDFGTSTAKALIQMGRAEAEVPTAAPTGGLTTKTAGAIVEGSLDTLTKAQLIEKALELGIEADDKLTKAQLIDLIESEQA